ncbi:hypothetical protein PAMA_002676 [Pampus argenteus]
MLSDTRLALASLEISLLKLAKGSSTTPQPQPHFNLNHNSTSTSTTLQPQPRFNLNHASTSTTPQPHLNQVFKYLTPYLHSVSESTHRRTRSCRSTGLMQMKIRPHRCNIPASRAPPLNHIPPTSGRSRVDSRRRYRCNYRSRSRVDNRIRYRCNYRSRSRVDSRIRYRCNYRSRSRVDNRRRYRCNYRSRRLQPAAPAARCSSSGLHIHKRSLTSETQLSPACNGSFLLSNNYPRVPRTSGFLA